MAVVITLDGPTRELPVLRIPRAPLTWRGTCPRCRDGQTALTPTEARLVLKLSGGRRGNWQATPCTGPQRWHVTRRTCHGRQSLIRVLVPGALLVAAALATVASVVPW